MRPIVFSAEDPERAAKEAMIRALSEADLRTAHALTRRAARTARAAGEMETLYGLTRGIKTLQRIAGEREIFDLARF